MTDTPGLLIHTTYHLAPADVEAFRSLASRMAAAARAHDGCAFLDVARDIGDPAVFHLIEGWRDDAALAAFGAGEAFGAVMGEAATLDVRERVIDAYAVAGRKSLDLP